MANQTQYIFPYSRTLYDAQGNVDPSQISPWPATLAQAPQNVQSHLQTSAYGTQLYVPSGTQAIVSTENQIIRDAFLTATTTVSMAGAYIVIGDGLSKEMQLEKLSRMTHYLKSPAASYSIGSVITGVGGLYNHWAHPEYYHNDPDKGSEGNPHPMLSTARSLASVSKHIATVSEGLGNFKMKALGYFGHGVDAVNGLLQSLNLIDAITNDHRTGKDVTIAAFSTASAAFANASNVLSYTEFARTKEGLTAIVGLKGLALSMTSISNMLEDPTIWGRLKEEVQSADFFDNLKGYSYHLMTDQLPDALVATGETLASSLPLIGDMLNPMSTASEDQEQMALKEWYKKNYPKTYTDLYEKVNQPGSTPDVIHITPSSTKIPVIYPAATKIPVIYPTGRKIPVLSVTSKKKPASDDPYVGLSIQELKDLAKAGKLKKQAEMTRFEDHDTQSLPNVHALLSDDQSLNSLFVGVVGGGAVANQALSDTTSLMYAQLIRHVEW